MKKFAFAVAVVVSLGLAGPAWGSGEAVLQQMERRVKQRWKKVCGEIVELYESTKKAARGDVAKAINLYVDIFEALGRKRADIENGVIICKHLGHFKK